MKSKKKQLCERCMEYPTLNVFEAVGQYFINFEKLMWLCKICVSVMTTAYGKNIRERQQFEKQIIDIIQKDKEGGKTK